MRETLYVGIVFGFDHDAGKLFRAGIAEHDAPIFAEGSIGFGEGARDRGERIERRLGFHFHVEDGLRVILEACDKGIEAAFGGYERSDFDGGEKPVAGRRILEKNDVSRLFAAKDVAAPKHFFEDVTIADIGAGERDVLACKNAFEAEVGHGSGDDAISGKLVL